MKNSNLFPLLNLASLKIIAQDWARRYPAIESLILYSGRGRSTLADYVMVAKATTTEDPQSPLDFVFEPLSGFKFRIKNLKPCDQRLKSEVLGRYIKKAQLTEAEAEEFRKQVSELNHIRRKRIEEEYAQKGAFQKDWLDDPFGRQLLKDLTSPGVYVYKDATTFIKWEDWLFRIIEKEEDLLYLEDDIIPDSAYLLYERNRLAGPTNRKNIPSVRTTLDSKSIRPPGTREAIPAPEKQADDSIPVISFCKKDDYWQIGKEGNEAHLKSLNGYELIQFLIRHENKSFDPITLYHKGNVPEELRPLLSGMGSQEKYDKKTFALVQKKTEELYEDKKTVDIEKQEEIQEKIERSKEYFAQSNKFSSERDKCKHNIRELIKRAIEKLHKEAEKKSALSSLKKYLTIEGPGQTIIIGLGSYYKPNPSDPVKWKLDSN